MGCFVFLPLAQGRLTGQVPGRCPQGLAGDASLVAEGSTASAHCRVREEVVDDVIGGAITGVIVHEPDDGMSSSLLVTRASSVLPSFWTCPRPIVASKLLQRQLRRAAESKRHR